jgi:hypothetical protein
LLARSFFFQLFRNPEKEKKTKKKWLAAADKRLRR